MERMRNRSHFSQEWYCFSTLYVSLVDQSFLFLGENDPLKYRPNADSLVSKVGLNSTYIEKLIVAD